MLEGVQPFKPASQTDPFFKPNMNKNKRYQLTISTFTREKLKALAFEHLYYSRPANYKTLSGKSVKYVSPRLSRAFANQRYQRGFWIAKHERLAPHANLQKYYNLNYIDNRPQNLRQARTWSTAWREHKTNVSLSTPQVIAILMLAEEHNINYNYDPEIQGLSGRKNWSPIGYLLSTFLEAVIKGDLVPKYD